MTTNLRSSLSIVSGVALVAVTAFSLVTAGTASVATVLGFCGLAIWALAQMFLLETSSRTSDWPRRQPVALASVVRVPARVIHVGVPAVVEFPRRRRAA